MIYLVKDVIKRNYDLLLQLLFVNLIWRMRLFSIILDECISVHTNVD